MISTALLLSVEHAINILIGRDPAVKDQLAAQAGLVFELDLSLPHLVLFITPTREGLLLRRHFDGLADARIASTGPALLRAHGNTQAMDALFDGDVTIEGDQDAAQRFLRALSMLDVDWGAWLAEWIGPAAAGVIEQHAESRGRQFDEWRETRLIEKADFLLHDAALLADSTDVNDFLEAVDTLRDRVDRLSQRIDQLASRQQDETA